VDNLVPGRQHARGDSSKWLKFTVSLSLTSILTRSTLRIVAVSIQSRGRCVIIQCIRPTDVMLSNFRANIRLLVTFLIQRSRSLCFTKAELALATSDIIIMDDTMHYQSMRLQCWKMARLHRLCYCQVYMDCEYNVCVERNQERAENARVPNTVMERMRDIFEIPGTQKPWDQLTVRFGSDFDNVDALWEIVKSQYWSAPAPALESESQLDTMIRQLTAETCSHQVDILTRKVLNEFLSNVPRKNVEKLARELNRDRRDILNKYRHFLSRQVFQDNSDQDSVQNWTNQFRLHCQSIIESIK